MWSSKRINLNEQNLPNPLEFPNNLTFIEIINSATQKKIFKGIPKYILSQKLQINFKLKCDTLQRKRKHFLLPLNGKITFLCLKNFPERKTKEKQREQKKLCFSHNVKRKA